MEIKVMLDSIQKVQDFVETTNLIECDVDVMSSKQVYRDGKSFLGLMSCNFRRPLTVIIHGDVSIQEYAGKLLGRFMVQ